MNIIHVLSTTLLAGCAQGRFPVIVEQGTINHGAFAPEGQLSIGAGAGNIHLSVSDGADSVRWTLRTQPAGCAEPAASAAELTVARRDRKCSIDWQVSAPTIADIRLSASVGDITLTAPADRAIDLRSRVGDIHLRLDDRELRHAGSAGSGDRLAIGDAAATPRIQASVGVGSITATLRTTGAARGDR